MVPDGGLFGYSNVHKTLRKILVEDHAKNTLPDVLARWRTLGGRGYCKPVDSAVPGNAAAQRELRPTDIDEFQRPRTAQSFCVPKAGIAAQGCDLSLNRYKEVVHAEVAYRPPE